MKTTIPSIKLLFILKGLFYVHLIVLFLFITFPLLFIFNKDFGTSIILFQYFRVIGLLFFFGALLWLYCIYFYYKYDKYSSAGLKLILLSIFYCPFYFYKVIWKRRRQLQNSYTSEPILGKSIHLVDEKE